MIPLCLAAGQSLDGAASLLPMPVCGERVGARIRGDASELAAASATNSNPLPQAGEVRDGAKRDWSGVWGGEGW